MVDKLRKKKDEAAKLAQKGKFDKAIKIYAEILEAQPNDVTARLKCGDLYRKTKRDAEAIECYSVVAQIYAEDGLLLKAIASCKVVLEIDSEHTETQKMLADLYAKKTGRSKAASPAVAAVVAKKVAKAKPVEEEIEIDIEEAPAEELPTIPLFSDLSKNAFIQLLEQMKMKNFGPSEVIIREGAVDDSMFIISHGKVKVTKTSDAGQEIVLAHLSDGAFFGEMALLSESPRTASVIAAEDTVLFEVSRDVLAKVIKNFPSVEGILNRFYRQRLLSNLMATSPIFRPLDGNQRKSLIEQFKSRELSANQGILKEGQKGDGLYMLLSGKVEVSKQISGKKKQLAQLSGGDIFGEMSLLNNEPVSASVKTLKKSLVLKLPRKTFSEIISTHPQFLAHLSDLSAERAKTTEAIASGQMEFSEEGLVLV